MHGSRHIFWGQGQFLMLIPKKVSKNIWMPISLDIRLVFLGYFKFLLFYIGYVPFYVYKDNFWRWFRIKCSKKCLQAYKPKYLTYSDLKVRLFSLFLLVYMGQVLFFEFKVLEFLMLIFFYLFSFMDQMLTLNFFNTSAVFDANSKKWFQKVF